MPPWTVCAEPPETNGTHVGSALAVTAVDVR